jgi:hypothetical protein
MRGSVFLYIILVSLLSSLTGCEDCGLTDEPSLLLNIQSQTAFRIDTLYGIGAVGKLLQTVSSLPTGQYTSWQLPLNLNADSTRYVLRIDGRMEAVTVFYKRNFYYRNRHCGYVFDLEKPATNRSQQAQTTRGKILSVDYRQNSFNSSFLRPATSTTGMYLSISL